MTDKLKMHSPDLTKANIDKLAGLFPNCVTETADENGNLKRTVDFDLLRQELSDRPSDGSPERYQLNWPGKRAALLAANSPTTKTLRADREESKAFESTANLFIEGDNLDALKLLQETYLNKVKMIYIDPPYNTGRDFLYHDDFSEPSNSYLIKSLQSGNDGQRLVANPESNGRFHSDWLSMMYSRVRLAKNLLSDDGVFISSIDDGEVSNLRKICDEVFGEDQFAAQIIWKKRNTPPNDRVIGAQHDYLLVYVKKDFTGIGLRPRTKEQIARYKNPDNHPKGPWVAGDLTANVKGGRFSKALYFPIVNPTTGQEFYPPNSGNWRFNRERIQQLIAEDAIYFGRDGSSQPKLKRFLCDVKEGTTWTTLWDFAPLNTSGSNEMARIFGNSVMFESPKPVGLLEHLVELAAHPNAIVMDFFAGASTMAHAVLSKNAKDGGRRRFIMVQLPEAIHSESEAGKAGFKTISELSRERIRRVGAELVETEHHDNWNRDVGFRSLKVDSSNFKDVYYTPDASNQERLFGEIDNIKEDRSDEDLLFQVLLDWGVDLSLPIQSERIAEKKVYFVDETVLAACFEPDIDEEFVKDLANRKPLRVVFRDSGYGDDSTKINVEQIFKLISPNTEVKTL